MRICFLEGDMSRKGGTERMTALLANALSDHHSVLVLSLRFDGDNIFFPLKDNVRHQVLTPAHGKSGILKQISEIHRILRDNNIQRVINVDIGTGFYGILAAIGTKAKVITWEHANYYNNWNSKVFPYFRRFAAKYSSRLVVLTHQDKDAYEHHIPHCAPITVISNPVSTHEFNYNADSKIILSAGLLDPIKGFNCVIELAKRLFPSRPGWSWVICGEGSERPRLEQLIRDAGLEDRIFLPGTIRDMDAQYKRAAFYVMTSKMEGLPMVLLEAKSWGLPLVSFDIVTGPRDIISHNINGYLVPHRDIDEMATKIGALIDDAALRVRFSQQSQVDLNRFEFEYVLKSWNVLLEEM